MPTIDYDEVIRIIKSKSIMHFYDDLPYLPTKEYKEVLSIFLDKKEAVEEMEIAKKRYR